MSDGRGVWRTYAIDSEGRRLEQLATTPEYADPESGPSRKLEAISALAGWEMEHVPTGLRISMIDRSGEPLEELSRLSDVPGVLREAAAMLGQRRRSGPARGPAGGWVQLEYLVAMAWLETGSPPSQAQVAEALDRDPSSLSRAVRGAGWESVVVVAAWILRRLQREIPAPEVGEPDALKHERERFGRLDLTGF